MHSLTMPASSVISTPGSPHLSHLSLTTRSTSRFRFGSNRTCINLSSTPQSLNQLFFRLTSKSYKRTSTLHGFKRFSPVMEWQDCTVKMEIDVPASVAYNCYSDREAIPRWMPFISSVKPIPNQKIHWRSLEGLPNRGAVRFYPKSPASCVVELTVSYEVPQLLAPVASALQPFLEGLLRRGLERFAKVAKTD